MNPCPVLVGRQQELSSLRALLDAGGGVAIVSGEAGIGKSRLIREFASEAQKVGRVVLWGRPEEVAQPGPYALIVDLLESIVERCGSGVKKDVRVLTADLLRSADDERPAPTPRSVAAEIRGLLAQLGDPPLVLFEDLHWGDEASHSVVLHLARAAADDGHIIVCTLRPESVPANESLGRLIDTLSRDRVATMISLEPLAEDETATMLEIMWGRAPREEELAALKNFGEGVPFFIEELAGAGPPDGSFRVPKTIEQSVAARVRGMGHEAERVLNAASLLAGQLDTEVLAAACALPEAQVARILVDAADTGLVADHENRLMFRHGLVRQAIATSIVSVEAVRIHGRLAQAIEQVHAKELDPLSPALAHHWSRADETESAVYWALRAGDRALAFAATEEAKAAFRLALELSRGEEIGAVLGLAETEFRDGNETEAAQLFRAGADRLISEGAHARAATALGRLAWALQGRIESSGVLSVLDEGLALVSRTPDSNDYARLMVQKGGLLCFVFNRAAEARPILEEAISISRRAGDESLVAEALDGLAQAADLEGASEDALGLGNEAIAAATRSGIVESIGRTHNNHAVKLATVGRPEEALETLQRGRDRLIKSHGRASVGALDVTRAWILCLMGLPTEVAHLTARGRAAWHRWQGYRWLLEVWAAIERGDESNVRAVMAEVASSLGDVRAILLAEQPLQPDAVQALFAQSLVFLAKGQADDVLELTRPILAATEGNVEPLDFGQLLTVDIRAKLLKRAFDDAEASLERLGVLVKSHTCPYLEAIELELRATLTGDRKTGEALNTFERAIGVFEKVSNSSDRARCLRLAATEMSQAAFPRDEIVERLMEARRLAEQAGAVVERNRIEAALRSHGVRPRAGRPRKDRSLSGGSGLSAREAEIAVLVAAGDTNTDIAQRLFLSERTVQDHITHALRKLGLPGRAALASWAVRNGMI